MSKRINRSTSANSASTNPSPSPKRNRFNSTSPGTEDSFQQLLDKMNGINNRIEELFGSLSTEISYLRSEIKQELEGVETTIKEFEKSLNSAWDTIGDIQTDLKDHSDFKKDAEPKITNIPCDLVLLQASQTRITSQQREIEVLKAKLAEEQEKRIELETYSRKENLRFMNIPEDTHENCTDKIYDVIENELDIRTDDIQFQAAHRVGKVRTQLGLLRGQ